MTNKSSNSPSPHVTRATELQVLQIADILNRMQSYVDDIKQQSERVVAVEYGGAANAGQTNEDGNPRDLISFELFHVMIDTASDCSSLYWLRDAIAELTRRCDAASATAPAA